MKGCDAALQSKGAPGEAMSRTREPFPTIRLAVDHQSSASSSPFKQGCTTSSHVNVSVDATAFGVTPRAVDAQGFGVPPGSVRGEGFEEVCTSWDVKDSHHGPGPVLAQGFRNDPESVDAQDLTGASQSRKFGGESHHNGLERGDRLAPSGDLLVGEVEPESSDREWGCESSAPSTALSGRENASSGEEWARESSGGEWGMESSGGKRKRESPGIVKAGESSGGEWGMESSGVKRKRESPGIVTAGESSGGEWGMESSGGERKRESPGIVKAGESSGGVLGRESSEVEGGRASSKGEGESASSDELWTWQGVSRMCVHASTLVWAALMLPPILQACLGEGIAALSQTPWLVSRHTQFLEWKRVIIIVAKNGIRGVEMCNYHSCYKWNSCHQC